MTDYQLMELVLLAAVAGYLIYRLYLVLGQSDNSSPLKKPGNVIPLRRSDKMREHINVKTNKIPNPKLKELLQADPTFDEDFFKKGAQAAFVMIVESFAKGDLNKIKPYLSQKVYDTFATILEKRRSKGEQLEVQVITITDLTILKTSVSRNVAKITVQIQSDQAITHRDSKGHDLYPDQDEIDRVTDQWVFQRQIGSSSPNWILDSLGSANSEKANG